MTVEIDLVIRDGRVFTPDGVVEGDLAVVGHRIVSVGKPISAAKEEVSAKGKLVMPGGVDTHAHIEQMSGMGQWNADTFETATQSAAMGGTTSVISFAAQSNGQPLAETVSDYAIRAARGAMIDYAFHITITDTGAPDFDADLGALIAGGHRSLKVFTTYNIQLSDAEVLKIFALARQNGALVCVHAENDAIIAQAKDALIQGRTHCPPGPRALTAQDGGNRSCRTYLPLLRISRPARNVIPHLNCRSGCRDPQSSGAGCADMGRNMPPLSAHDGRCARQARIGRGEVDVFPTATVGGRSGSIMACVKRWYSQPRLLGSRPLSV